MSEDTRRSLCSLSDIDFAVSRIEALERQVKAADELVVLVSEGECPWRDDTSHYREWWQDRKIALAVYLSTKKGT